jgi:hypothetical protein
MLVPEAHLIFVCPQNCLRGVTLVAAQMQAADRFSTVAVLEADVIDGDMEALTIDGVAEIIAHLPKRPPAVLVFTNCIHHFVGTDLEVVYATLREKYPDIQFTDCYMNPIMRQSGLNPEQTMRKQLYSLLKPQAKDQHSVNIIGNNFPMDASNDLMQLLTKNGFTPREVTTCQNYDQYQAMASSVLNIITLPVALAAGKMLAEELDQPPLFLPLTFDATEISTQLQQLSAALDIAPPDVTSVKAQSEAALAAALADIGQTPIAISFSACPRPLSLAKLLLDHGFNVTKIFADMFISLEAADFAALQKMKPDLELYPLTQATMRQLPRTSTEPTLAIGAEAAYYTGTGHYVDLIEGSGLFGFNGIVRLAQLLQQAHRTVQDQRNLIQIANRGRGCLL